ncbi:MAG: biotin--[acetyl-CoA-carboxylase] ligase [Thiotrichales bacterium]|nr:biotin--[acetyl-CoA-carboxylase] ligase [Thiotrichales bacterium]
MFNDLVQLERNLEKDFPQLMLALHSTIDSTNGYLKTVPLEAFLCYATEQTGGYGQRGSSWYSSISDLTFSLQLPFSVSVHQLQGLSAMVALEVVMALNDFYQCNAQIKWPNDLVMEVNEGGVEIAKLGGILIEVHRSSHQHCWLIIGIGLNGGTGNWFEPIPESLLALPKVGCDFSAYKQEHNYAFFKALIGALLQLSKDFTPGCFSASVEAFKKHDYFIPGQMVFVYDTGTMNKGVYQGIDAAGELCVRVNDQLRKYRSGSVSIRPCGNV